MFRSKAVFTQVHTIMTILSSFAHLQVVPNLYEFLLNTKEDICEDHCVGSQIVSVSPLTSIVFSHTMVLNGDQEVFGYQQSSKYLFYVQ